MNYRLGELKDLGDILQLSEKSDDQIFRSGTTAVLEDPYRRRGRYYVGILEDRVKAFAFIFPEWIDWRNSFMFMWWIQIAKFSPESESSKSAFLRFILEQASTEGIQVVRILESDATRSFLDACAREMSSHYTVFEKNLTNEM